MKTRLGFVSNSSSSSFACIAAKTTLEEIDSKELSNTKYLVELEGQEREGNVYAHITSKKMIDFLIQHGHTGNVYEILAESDEGETDLPDIFSTSKTLVLVSMIMDQYTPSNLKDLEELYANEGF